MNKTYDQTITINNNKLTSTDFLKIQSLRNTQL